MAYQKESSMDSTKLQAAIAAFIKNKKTNAAYHDDNWAERMPIVGCCCKECDAYGDQKCT